VVSLQISWNKNKMKIKMLVILYSAFALMPHSILCKGNAIAADSPSIYSKYFGTAKITRITQSTIPDPQTKKLFDMFIQFQTYDSIKESWYLSDSIKERPVFSGIIDPWWVRQYFFKSGNSYACTLEIMKDTTIHRFSLSMVKPTTWSGYDTTTPWIMPDTVEAYKPFFLSLLDYHFRCDVDFGDTSAIFSGNDLTLWYKPVLLAAECMPPYLFFGVPYSIQGLPAGKYPVYGRKYSIYFSVSDTPIVIDTLVVIPGVNVTNNYNRYINQRMTLDDVSFFQGKIKVSLTSNVIGDIRIDVFAINGTLLNTIRKRVSAPETLRFNFNANGNNPSPAAKGLYLVRISSAARSILFTKIVSGIH
jgi:hypothetical protein